MFEICEFVKEMPFSDGRLLPSLPARPRPLQASEKSYRVPTETGKPGENGHGKVMEHE